MRETQISIKSSYEGGSEEEELKTPNRLEERKNHKSLRKRKIEYFNGIQQSQQLPVVETNLNNGDEEIFTKSDNSLNFLELSNRILDITENKSELIESCSDGSLE